MIEIPEFNWSGDKKKIEIRDPEIIRKAFELAALMRTDFTAAIMRILTTSADRVIQEERLTRERLSSPFGGLPTNTPLPTSTPSPVQYQPPVPPVVEQAPQSVQPQKAKRSGADLI